MLLVVGIVVRARDRCHAATLGAHQERFVPDGDLISSTCQKPPDGSSRCCRCCRPRASGPAPSSPQRLGVTERTVRNDVDRLRQLGYPVLASRGSVGGYRLSAGTAMPPLLLDDDEAVAIAVALSTASGGAVDGLEETALRALTKLLQVLPKRLERPGRRAPGPHRAGGRPAATAPTWRASCWPMIAAAARDREVVRFAYSDHSGSATERRVEPYRLVNWGQRWYLVAFDLERDDWRTFRVRPDERDPLGRPPLPRPRAPGRGHRGVRRQQDPPGADEGDRPGRRARAGRRSSRSGWARGRRAASSRSARTAAGSRSAPASPEDIAFWLGVLDCRLRGRGLTRPRRRRTPDQRAVRPGHPAG